MLPLKILIVPIFFFILVSLFLLLLSLVNKRKIVLVSTFTLVEPLFSSLHPQMKLYLDDTNNCDNEQCFSVTSLSGKCQINHEFMVPPAKSLKKKNKKWGSWVHVGERLHKGCLSQPTFLSSIFKMKWDTVTLL